MRSRQRCLWLVFAVFFAFSCSSDPDPDPSVDASGDVGDDAMVDVAVDVSDVVDDSDGDDADAQPADQRPGWPADTELNAVPTGPTGVRLSWGGAVDDNGVIAFEVRRDGAVLGRVAGSQFSFEVNALDPSTTYVFSVVALDQIAQASDPLTTSYRPTTPAPEDVRSELGPTVIPTVDDLAERVYGGDDPIQRDVVPGAIEPARLALVRGKVVDAAGDPIGGAHVRVHRDADLGYTLTRADGVFDIVVNGGGPVVLTLRADGYMTVQREVRPGWRDTAHVQRVVMLEYDPNVTTVDLSQPGQVATGSVIDDGDGARQGILIFRQGTGAQMVLPNGTTQPLDTMDVRISEYTVGGNGPDAMPGALPPATAYTYAVNLTVDEAEAAGALRVDFDQTVAYYVDNFMGYAPGEPVPNGYYDFQRAVWVRDLEGRIVEVLRIENGRAVLDVTGTGSAATASELAELDITDEELEALAGVRAAGDMLWRVPMTHFTPYDHNWGVGCSPEQDCIGPDDARQRKSDSGECQFGSIIECTSQTMRESISVPGTEFQLSYSTYYQHGYLPKRTFEADLGRRVPEKYSTLVAGITADWDAKAEFDPVTGRIGGAVWDGMMQGERYNAGLATKGFVGYCYAMVRGGAQFGSIPQSQDIQIAASVRPSELGRGEGIPISACGGPVSFSGGGGFFAFFKTFPIMLEGWSAPGQHLGGWTLSAHHFYDRGSDILYRGDGTRQERTQGVGVETYAGIRGQAGDIGEYSGPLRELALRNPTEVAFAPDGTTYILETSINRVLRERDGDVEQVAGAYLFKGSGWIGSGYNGDGQPAKSALLDRPQGIAVGPDGALYIADTRNHRIRRVDPVTNEITTIAGAGADNTVEAGFGGDGGPAYEARLARPHGVAVGPGGDIYIADTDNHVIRRIGTDGVIETIAGIPGQSFYDGDGGFSRQAKLDSPRDVAVAPDGTIYIADYGNRRIRRVRVNGRIDTLAGSGNPFGPTGRDGPAMDVALDKPSSIAVSRDSRVFVGEASRVVEIRDGRVDTTIGRCWTRQDGCDTTRGGPDGYELDGEFGPDTRLGSSEIGVGVDPAGRIYAADTTNLVVRRVGRRLRGVDEQSVVIRSEDGSEVYVFDEDGRHLETRAVSGGQPLYTFDYDANGRLVRIADADGLETRIERDADGFPVAIVGPWGDRTALVIEGDGFDAELRRVVSETGRTWQMEYAQDRMLTRMVAPGGREHTYSYDSSGRLVGETGPGGASKTLTRTAVVDQEIIESIEVADGAGWSKDYVTRRGPGDVVETVKVGATGLETVTRVLDDSRATTTYPDGMIRESKLGQDPRLSAIGSYVSSTTERSPGGIAMQSSYTPEYEFADPTSAVPTRMIRRTRVNGREWVDEYDVTTGVQTSTTPEGRTSTTVVDAFGRVVERTEPGRHITRNQYDGRGRLARTEFGDSVTTYEYDAQGNLVATVGRDAQSDAELSRTARTYDADGRLASLTRADGTTVQYVWNDADQITSLTLPGGVTHTFTRSLAGNLTSSTRPNGEVNAWEWDSGGNMTRQVMASGTTTDFTYDAASRLDLVEAGGRQIDYQYDPQTGHPIVMVDESGERLDFGWDGRLQTSESWSGTVTGQVDVAWNNNHQITSRRVDGANPVTYDYDRDGLLTRAGDLQLTYAPDRLDVATTVLGNVTTSVAVNQQGRYGGYSARFGQTPIMDVTQSHDAFHDLTQRVETIDGVTTTYDYGYDALGRLSEVREDGSLVESYSYDVRGNRTASQRDGASQTGTYNDNDELITYAGMRYGYDADGNVIFSERAADGSERTDYQWGPMATLDGVDLPDGTSVEYLQDPKGRRVAKFVNGVMERGWLYKNIISPVVELDGSGNVRSRFVFGTFLHVPDYMVRDGRTYRLLHDANGSVRLVVDVVDGTIVQRLDYDAWGRVLADTNPGFQPFAFAGGLWDPDTELLRFGARHYDPFTGRWMQPEPRGFEHGNGSLYEYAMGSPLKFVDVDGELAPIIAIGIAIAVSALIDMAMQYAAKGCINWWQVGLAGALGGLTGGIGGGISSAVLSRLSVQTAFRIGAWQGLQASLKRGVGNAALTQIAQQNIKNAVFRQTVANYAVNSATGSATAGVSAVGMNLAGGKTALNTSDQGVFNGVGTSMLMGSFGGAIGGFTSQSLTSRYFSETNASAIGELAAGVTSGIPLKMDHWQTR